MKVFSKVSLLFLICLSPLHVSGQVICIDPGHGYGPAGENSDGRTTEEIVTNCEVGLLLRDTLEKSGYAVIMTRTDSDTGSWMSLTQRAELADNYDSERLLSIHCNGGGGTGTETFWCERNTPNRAIDSIFSFLTQQKMVYHGEWFNRRSIEDNLYLGFHLGVLKGATPGCLSEIGFVDTPADLVKLQDPEWQKRFAIAYFEAIAESFKIDYPSMISEQKDTVQLYPNPFTGILYVSGFMDTPKEVELFELNGRKLASPDWYVLPDGVFVFSGFPVLPAGTYILVIHTKSDVISARFTSLGNN